MTRHRRSMSLAVGLSTGALVVAGALPASAHQHPTPIERAAPGVVFVQAQAQVDVALVEHRQTRQPPGVPHIVITQSTSTPVMAAASGFVVDRTGTVVTTGGISAMDPNRAQVYAVNQAFHEAYGTPIPADPFARQQVAPPGDPLQQRLQACYPPQATNDAGGCVVGVTANYVVYPYVTDQAKYGTLKASLLPSSTPDVAVLQVRGVSMPTVALAQSTQGAQALSDLGFTGPPDANHQLQSDDTHLQQVGGEVLKTQNLAKDELADQVKLAQAVPAGLLGGPLVAEEGQVIGFLVPPQGQASVDNPPRLVDATAIRKVLTAEGITPRRGPVDTTFEAAMHPFKNGAYADSIPSLKQTLALYPGHAIATQDLAKAEQAVGSGQAQASGGAAPDQGTAATDSTASTGRSIVPIVVTVVVVLLLLAAAIGFLLMRRRRGAAGESSGTPSPTDSPSGARAAVPVAAVRRREQPSAGVSTPTSPPAGMPVVSRTGPQGTSGSRTGGERTSGERGGTDAGSARGPARSPARPRGDSLAAGPAKEPAGPARQVPKQASAPSGGAVAPAGRPRPDVGSAASARDRGTSTPPSGPPRGRPSRVDPRVAPGPPRDVRAQQSPAEKALFCTACGTRLVPEDRYCPRCGHQAG